MKRKGWRGYVFSRPINGHTIPQRVQNLVLRTYAEKSGTLYLLSATEYHIPGSYMMLESLYKDLPGVEGLLFYSLSMLPETKAQRRRLYAAVLGAGCGLRFALEELSAASEAELQLLEDVFACRRLSANPPLGLLS